MNPHHRRFAEEYAVDHNGAQAAERAGYTANRAKQTAHRRLARPDVASLVERLDAEKREQLGVDQTQWLEWALEVRVEAMGGRSRTYRSELARDEHGDVIYDPNLTAAAKILDAIGRHFGLMLDRHQSDHDDQVVYTLHIDRPVDEADATRDVAKPGHVAAGGIPVEAGAGDGCLVDHNRPSSRLLSTTAGSLRVHHYLHLTARHDPPLGVSETRCICRLPVMLIRSCGSAEKTGNDRGIWTGDAGGTDAEGSAAGRGFVERARGEGFGLVGMGGLLTGLTRQVLEASLEAEMTEHLGYHMHDPGRRERGSNSRNGTRAKTVLTDVGPVEIAVPRDRDGSFEPRIVKKRQRRLTGVDEM